MPGWARSPLILTAGQQDTPLAAAGSAAGARPDGDGAPLVRGACRRSAQTTAALLHRAFKVAGDPPPGPVFLSCAEMYWSNPVHFKPLPPWTLPPDLPDPQAVERAAACACLGASNPAIVCGEEIAAQAPSKN